MIKLYSNGCPKCKVLKAKLDEKKIEYEENNNIDEMKTLGIQFLPVLEVNGELMNFKQAFNWVGEQE